jgi:DNA-directed RNA polymerase specialized sigma subunit
LSISRSYVSRIEKRALKKLFKELNSLNKQWTYISRLI